jgi:hypothetical protein
MYPGHGLSFVAEGSKKHLQIDEKLYLGRERLRVGEINRDAQVRNVAYVRAM